jgi:hypothetical protein
VPARSYSAIHDVPNFKNWTPRLGIAYDPTGHGKTVMRASLNKYMQGMAINLVSAANPLQFDSGDVTVPWNCTGPACIANGPQIGQLDLSAFNGFPSTNIHLDPNLRRPYSWEAGAGFQQQLPSGIIVSITAWHRGTFDAIGRANLATPSSAYTPVALRIPAGTSFAGSSFVVYNQLPSTLGKINYQVMNSRLLNIDYRGIDFTLHRQMTSHWMVLAGATVGRNRGATRGDIQAGLDDLNNPYNNFNRLGLVSDDTPVQIKIAGQYSLPRHFELSGNLQHGTGTPLNQLYTVTSAVLAAGTTLTQSSQSLYLAAAGAVRLPNVNLVDIRLSRLFALRDRWTLRPEFDVYNLLNAATVMAENTSVNAGSLFLNPQAVLPPRLFKVGLKIDF